MGFLCVYVFLRTGESGNGQYSTATVLECTLLNLKDARAGIRRPRSYEPGNG